MRILCACEESGTLVDALISRGHDAWSCDLLPSRGNHPERHIQGDAVQQAHRRSIVGSWWDVVIAFPPCTRLTVAGARWFKGREAEQEEAVAFFMQFTTLKCAWAIENPIGIMSRRYRKPDQIIQPWQFGHGETKSTCLWLNRLPKLNPTNVVAGRVPRVHHESPGTINGLTRAQRRSQTFQGIADAMASQWFAEDPSRRRRMEIQEVMFA